MGSQTPDGTARFAGFELDLRTGELGKNGRRVRLQAQPLKALRVLLEHSGELVTREQLRREVWPEDTFVDFDHGLNKAVAKLRDAVDESDTSPSIIETLPRLGYRFIPTVEWSDKDRSSNGDSSDNPRFVETLPRRGYHFIAPVEASEPEAKTPTAALDALNQSRPRPRPRWISAVALLFLLISVGAFLVNRLRIRQSEDGSSNVQQNLRVTPLTTLPGMEVFPSFSPDGSQVAFAWDGGNSNATSPFNLYVKAIGFEKIEQLTHEPADRMVPAWSPDGSTIAFARQGGNRPGIFSIPARGGAERKLADANLDLPPFISLGWSPDGRQLVYSTTEGIRLVTTETGEVRPVNIGGCVSYAAAFSPDGKWIAFTCGVSRTFYLDLLSTKGGLSKHLSTGGGRVAWTNDSQRIVSDGLWEFNVHGGEPRRLMFADAVQPAIAAKGDRLAYTAFQLTLNIWRADTRTGSRRSVFAPATVEQRLPDISPDGKQIVFMSTRSGSEEIWLANLDGSDTVQLSNYHAQTGSPRWSPDGHWIVFDSRVTGKPALYLVDPATALPRQISTKGIDASVPSWSADGKWIYFHSESLEPTGRDALYRVSPQGGTPERMAQARGIGAQESRDGRLLYFAAGERDAVMYVLNIATGEERALAGMPKLGIGSDWVLSSKGIFFVDFGQQPGIDFFDFSLHRVTKRIPLDKQPTLWGGLSLSPDETWIAYSQVDVASSHLMLVEGFR
jgi:Tol biopolymer transport system component/DNA-binding winged helix-turn-helix (wHTH) protein